MTGSAWPGVQLDSGPGPEWKREPLAEVCTKTASIDPATTPDREYDYIDVSSVSAENLRITGTAKVKGTAAPSRARKVLRAGDVIFATVRPTLRRVALVPSSLDGQLASTAFCVIRANRELADPAFLYYSSITREFVENVGILQRGASYPAVTDSDVLKSQILLPPLSEQRAIACVLLKLQTRVEIQDRIVATLKDLKAATMAKLFREGLRGEPIKQTEIGELPEGWDVVPLGDVLNVAQYGLSIRGAKTGRYPILRMNCQEAGEVVFRDLQFVDLETSTFEKYRLNPGDILFNRTNSYELVGRSAMVEDPRPAVFASYLLRLVTNQSKLLPAVLNDYLALSPVQDALKGFATRAVGQSNISASRLRLLPVPLPPLNEQHELANISRELSSAMRVDRSRTELLSRTFDSLLKLLMTGQVRVTPALARGGNGHA